MKLRTPFAPSRRNAIILAIVLGCVSSPAHETFFRAQSQMAGDVLKNPAGAAKRIADAYGKLPLAFEENNGQAASGVNFLSRAPGYTLLLKPTEAVLALRKPRVSVKHLRPSCG